MPKATIADVARMANVSTMTVSRVVNNKGVTSAATRSRVEEAITTVGYRPNRLARALTQRRTQTLGLVVPDIANPFFADIVRGAEDEAWERGYTLLIGSTVEQAERERRLLDGLEERHVDGLLLCSSRLSDALLTELIAAQPATLLVNRVLSGSGALTLQTDDADGARQALAHLLSRGHQRIGLLAGPESSQSGRLRLEGYRSALDGAGLEVNERNICFCTPDERGGYEAGLALLHSRPELEALFCYNDLVAIGVLQACRELGRGVPGDLAIVGCDDIRLASLIHPALTTLRTDRVQLGRQAVQLLLGQLGELPETSEQPSDVTTLKPELIVRSSAP